MHYPDFTNKVVSFSLFDDDSNHDLVGPYFEEQGGRLFVLGHVPTGATDSDWTDGKLSALAWESVAEYVVFDDLDDYAEAIDKSETYDAMNNDRYDEMYDEDDWVEE